MNTQKAISLQERQTSSVVLQIDTSHDVYGVNATKERIIKNVAQFFLNGRHFGSKEPIKQPLHCI